MKDRVQDIDQLTAYLEAEAAGDPFDRGGALRLAQSLAQAQPEIRHSLSRIIERLAD